MSTTPVEKNMQTTIKIESPEPVRSTSSKLTLSATTLAAIFLLFAAILTGAILATYFGKKCSDCSSELVSKCASVYCSNQSLILGISVPFIRVQLFRFVFVNMK